MNSSFLVPGEHILAETGYLRGHGTYISLKNGEPELVSSVAGDIHRIDKLVSVKPIKSRLVKHHNHFFESILHMSL